MGAEACGRSIQNNLYKGIILEVDSLLYECFFVYVCVCVCACVCVCVCVSVCLSEPCQSKCNSDPLKVFCLYIWTV